MRSKKDKPDSLECLLTIRELAFLAGTTPRVIERLVSFEIIGPARSEPEPCFATDVLAHVRKAVRMHEQLGVSWSSMGLVLDLLHRIETLESRGGPGDDEESS